MTATCLECSRAFVPARHSPGRYCSRSCAWKATKGPEYNARISRDSTRERAARKRYSGGRGGYVKFLGRHEHRVVAELMLGRPLRRGEIVHHVDGDPANNWPMNLEILTAAEHMRRHGIGIPGKPLAHEPWKYRRSKEGGRS